ncbi:MAG: histidine kinase [Akkermansiaceae bacterium]|nr:histidine kinase [Akkermansiaceae bacterium]
MQNLQNDIATIRRIEAVPRILDVVCRTTGMGFAAVARVTEDRWIACGVLDRINFGLQPGGELQIETTICHEIRQNRQPVVINHVAEDPDYCGHHTPAMYGLQSYISMPILLPDGRFFGTLCAIDPRPAVVNTPEIVEMFRLFAELIAFHIDASEKLATSESTLLAERETSELREQFVAVLGHDLRNPLAAISSAAGVLGMAAKDDRIHKLADIIQSSVSRMAGLIENVLDFARGRLGDGITVDRRDEIELQPVLDQIVGEIRSTHPERQIDTDFSLTEKVACDPGRIGQLFSNLLGNAISHGRAAEAVKVRAFSKDGVFELSVSNASEPIPASKLERLFHPFSRGDSKAYQQGLGLGLYIASEIAKAHGGTLEVLSIPEETRFTFRMMTRTGGKS